MKTITSRLHKKERNSLLLFGLIYTLFGVYEFLFEYSETIRGGYLLIGLGMLGFLAYQLYTRKLVSVISWDERKLGIKRVNEKPVYFHLKDIQTLKLTDKSLTINAGMGTGEMIDLNYFKKADLLRFKMEFLDGVRELQSA